MAEQHRPLIGLALLMAASLAGCALPNPYRASPVAEPVPANEAAAVPGASNTPGAPEVAAPATREYRLGPAAESLVGQAHAQIAHGELPSAAVTLERALHIEPANPLLWLELAQLGLAADDPRRAEGYARKALALASGDRRARAHAGHALAAALHAEHRDQEARDLESQPWMN